MDSNNPSKVNSAQTLIKIILMIALFHIIELFFWVLIYSYDAIVGWIDMIDMFLDPRCHIEPNIKEDVLPFFEIESPIIIMQFLILSIVCFIQYYKQKEIYSKFKEYCYYSIDILINIGMTLFLGVILIICQSLDHFLSILRSFVLTAIVSIVIKYFMIRMCKSIEKPDDR